MTLRRLWRVSDRRGRGLFALYLVGGWLMVLSSCYPPYGARTVVFIMVALFAFFAGELCLLAGFRRRAKDIERRLQELDPHWPDDY